MDFKELVDFDNVKRIIKLSMIGNFSVLIKGNSNSGKTSIFNCIRKIFNLKKCLKIEGKKFYILGNTLVLDNLQDFTSKEIEVIFKLHNVKQFYIASNNCYCGNSKYEKNHFLDNECESKSIKLFKSFKFLSEKIDFIIELPKPHSLLYNKSYSYYSEDTLHMLNEITSAKKLLLKKVENIPWTSDTNKLYERYRLINNMSLEDLSKTTKISECVSALNSHSKVEAEDLGEAIQYMNCLEEFKYRR
jgi:hypothetical protein